MPTATSAQLSYILDEVTSGVAINEFVEAPNLMGALYSMRTSAGRRERMSSISGLTQLQAKNPTQPAAEEVPIQQFQKTFLHSAFALQVPVERELIDDEDWGWFQDLGIQLGMAANRTMETKAAEVFNDAFLGAVHSAEDGLSVCNTAHVNVDGGNSQSNSGTSAISASNVKATLTAMRKFTDYRGEKISVNPDAILAPVDKEPDLWEIVRASQLPGGANNDANYLQNRFQIFAWNYLTDTNNWFMIDRRMAAMNLLWFQRTGFETFGDGDLFVGTRRIGSYMRFSHGVKDWRFVYGQNVA